jgi:hypothetical protein
MLGVHRGLIDPSIASFFADFSGEGVKDMACSDRKNLLGLSGCNDFFA